MEFNEWLHINTSLSDSSIYKYSRAVHTISNNMMKLGVISRPLTEMENTELEIAIAIISLNPDFIAKDKKGNKMYSNSIKQFKYYCISTRESSDIIEETIINQVNLDDSLSTTTKKAVIDARLGQGIFRANLINKYEKCIVTGVDNKRLLIASHIKPWAISNNYERLSEDNGLILTPTFDKLFDIGLITFDSNSKMKISRFVGKENESRLHIEKNIKYNLKLSDALKKNLEFHNDVVFIAG